MKQFKLLDFYKCYLYLTVPTILINKLFQIVQIKKELKSFLDRNFIKKGYWTYLPGFVCQESKLYCIKVVYILSFPIHVNDQ
jgi:hypothetical protein